jgi:hypothetical protein
MHIYINILIYMFVKALKGKSRELSEQTGITTLIGEYRARCLFSKVWTLRDAAITKVGTYTYTYMYICIHICI